MLNYDYNSKRMKRLGIGVLVGLLMVPSTIAFGSEETDFIDAFVSPEDILTGPGATEAFEYEFEEDQISELELAPEAEMLNLSESFHEEYGVYELSMNDEYFIFSNVGNGGITEDPVYVEFPANVTYEMEFNGIPQTYISNRKVSAKGTYVFRITAIENPEAPLLEQQEYNAVFRFRIQEKLPETTEAVEIDMREALESEAQSISQEEALSGIPEIGAEPEEQLPESTEDLEETLEESQPEQAIMYVQKYDPNTKMYASDYPSGIQFNASIPRGFMGNEPVFFEFPEGLEVVLTRDGEAIEYVPELAIEEPGEYIVTIGSDTFEFTIASYVSELSSYQVPLGFQMSSAKFGEEEIAISDPNSVPLLEDGQYFMTMVGSDGQQLNVELEKDTVPPVVDVAIASGAAVVQYGSDDIVGVYLSKDGVDLQSFSTNDISDPGSYVLRVVDAAGNETAQSFDLNFTLNTFAIVGIIIVVALIIGGVIFTLKVKKSLAVR